jgi:filamentous hemagglutinin
MRLKTPSGQVPSQADNTEARRGDAPTGIGPIFDADRIRREVNAQVAITQEFAKQANKAVGDYAKTQYDQAKAVGMTA